MHKIFIYLFVCDNVACSLRSGYCVALSKEITADQFTDNALSVLYNNLFIFVIVVNLKFIFYVRQS